MRGRGCRGGGDVEGEGMLRGRGCRGGGQEGVKWEIYASIFPQHQFIQYMLLSLCYNYSLRDLELLGFHLDQLAHHFH